MKHTKTVLPNGVRVITVPMKDNPTVTVMVSVGTGAYYEEPKEAGLSHFLEHMCFKGTEKRPSAKAITTELDSLGAAYNAFTSFEVTGYYAKADARHFEAIADVVADIYKHSTFPEGEIAKEKGVVMGEIDMYADDPQEKIADVLREHMYKGQPAERSVLGTKETVGAITRDDLVRYHSLQYKANNTVLTIAGGIEEEAMLGFARRAFGDMPAGEVRPEFETVDRDQRASETVFIDKDTDQAHIILAWRMFDRSHPDRYAARVARAILVGGMSSRLFYRLRDEMGSGYYVHGAYDLYRSFGQFYVATGTTAQRVPEIVGAVIEEVERLKAEPVSKAELDKVKELIRSRIRMSLETSDNAADFFADQELRYGQIQSPAEVDAIISAIEAEDVQRVAGLAFDKRKLTVAAIGKGIDKEAVAEVIAA